MLTKPPYRDASAGSPALGAGKKSAANALKMRTRAHIANTVIRANINTVLLHPIHAPRALRSARRSGDELGRFGGDEFLVMLPATSVAQAEQLARRLTLEVSALPVMTTAAEIKCSISVGVAERAP